MSSNIASLKFVKGFLKLCACATGTQRLTWKIVNLIILAHNSFSYQFFFSYQLVYWRNFRESGSVQVLG